MAAHSHQAVGLLPLQLPVLVLVFAVYLSVFTFSQAVYVVDNQVGLGRRFDGIGGLSGGGATSKLLVNYQEPYRSQILDYLFKPNFGASLHILKVEIGGDAQSTDGVEQGQAGCSGEANASHAGLAVGILVSADGSESSHQHEEHDENYKRGYEWWLMLEAKKRNPNIKLYCLPWGFPGWLGGKSGSSPYVNNQKTARYVLRWINAAKTIYGLDIDYVGIWNERPYNTSYIKILRSTLDAAGYTNTRIVAADGGWNIAGDVLKDPKLADAVDVLGAHYPGTTSSAQAVQTGLQLWASEDYSTFNDNVGAGCWARILNQNYVNGNMTSTISWNLIASYYQNLPFGRDALMTAMEPWSGHYVVESPIWITAHTTQFTNTNWHYLHHGMGSGKLTMGGSYVSLVGPSGDYTMVIETMAKLAKLYVWYSKLGYNGQPTELFTNKGPMPVTRGMFSLHLEVDTIYTITSISTGIKGEFGKPPTSKAFPLPYFDNYEKYQEFQEASNFAPQIGVWEVHKTSDPIHGQVNRQVVLNTPVKWCAQGNNKPIAVGGNFNWTDVSVQTDVYIPSVNGTNGVYLGARVNGGGCGVGSSKGLFFTVIPSMGKYTLSFDIEQKQLVVSGDSPVTIKSNTWFKLTLIAEGDTVMGFINTERTFFVSVRSTSANGFAAFGTTSYGYADFDNLLIQQP